MSWFLGIDTSNYTSSVAVYNTNDGTMLMDKLPLPVKKGNLGLRQSDAVFFHVQQLGGLIENISRQVDSFAGVGASVKPRDLEGSYMPCFLVGKLVATAVSQSLKIPMVELSHQTGHIGAVLYDTGQHQLLRQPFIGFHFSGGTTESVYVTPGKDNPFVIKPISQSLDLYAGQGIDRVGSFLDLDFPAGPALEQLALKSDKEYKIKPYFKDGNPSLSGLENQSKSLIEKGTPKEDIAKFAIDWIYSVVKGMTVHAKKIYPNTPVVYGGGVMSNSIIKDRITNEFGGHFASPTYSADNAGGIAFLTGEMLKKEGLNANCNGKPTK